MLKEPVRFPQEYLGFVLLNLFDLFLTGYIFRYQGIEANAVASGIISRFGYRGFVCYKFLLVTIVILACEGISRKNERLSKLIILFGSTVYALVVLYEILLIVHVLHGIHIS